MAYNLPLKYFFLSILPGQMSKITELIEGSQMAKKEVEGLT